MIDATQLYYRKCETCGGNCDIVPPPDADGCLNPAETCSACKGVGFVPARGDQLSTFTWLEDALFVPDEHGGHIEFNDMIWRPDMREAGG
jgi:hypothetical protein